MTDNRHYVPSDLADRIATALSCAWWLAHRDAGLALEMRDEFCREWYVEADDWNAAVDSLADYSQRQGEDTDTLEALRRAR